MNTITVGATIGRPPKNNDYRFGEDFFTNKKREDNILPYKAFVQVLGEYFLTYGEEISVLIAPAKTKNPISSSKKYHLPIDKVG